MLTIGTFVRPDEAGRLVDDMNEPLLSDAQVNGTAPVGTADGSDRADAQDGTNNTGTAERGALRPAFMSGLATAMREAAVRERERITGTVAEDAAVHVEKVRSRAAIETEELRRLAEEDVEHIHQWSAAEIERIQSESAQKIDDRRSSLDEYLKQHDAIIETEIQGVDGAVRDYEATLDRFFAELSAETEPGEIVRRAGQLPAPPDLDEIRAAARASAMTHIADSETSEGVETVAEAAPLEAEPAAEPVEAVAEAAPLEAEPAAEPVEAVAEGEAVAEAELSEAADSSDDGTMAGVMDDGAGSVEPSEVAESSDAEVAVAEDQAPVDSETASEETPAVPEPVGVMDEDAQRVPSWPEPAPRSEAAQLAPTVDHTSAAVRLLRSVAPWTAPTHAGRSPSEPD